MVCYLITKKKEHCYGCRACEHACPVKSIKMHPDQEGFLYPIIDNNLCTNCGLCIKKCPFRNDAIAEPKLQEQLIFAAWAKDDEIRRLSSSGGVFSTLATYVLNNNGVVFGCAFDKNMTAKHISITNINDLNLLRGSKYVQSDTSETYLEVKKYLEKEVLVFYTGTPCQIAGLKSFLSKLYENLITADLVCHGVPSPKLFSKYIGYLENKHKGVIVDYKFRDKTKNGWSLSSLYILLRNKRMYQYYGTVSFSPYYFAFLNNMAYRLTCYDCLFASSNRIGDVTLADFWGIEKTYSDIDVKKGVSLLLVNTQKGINILQILRNELNLIESNLEIAIEYNSNLSNPSNKPPERNYLYKELDILTFKELTKKYLRPDNYRILKMKSLVPDKLKAKIKLIVKFTSV